MSSQPSKQKDTVTELCIKLGCCSKDTKWSRGRQPALARKTGTFRKNFIGADTFPIEYDDPIVQECALRFFDEDRENAVQMIDGERDKKAFFHGKSGEIKNDRFSSPDDKETILTLLARLFCCQEKVTRYNLKRFRAKVSELAERRENGRGGKSARRWDAEWATDEYMSTACPSADDDDSEFDLTDDDVEMSAVASDAVTELDPVRANLGFPNLAMEDVPNSENSCYSAEARELIPRADETITVNGSFAKSHQAAEFECSTANQVVDAENHRRLGPNVEIKFRKHLQLCYPRSLCRYDRCDISNEATLEGFPAVQWLVTQDELEWPKDAKHFMWRIMHENYLYSKARSTQQTELLLTSLLKYLQLTCNAHQQKTASRKVQRFAVRWSSRWNDEGLLVISHGLLQRSAHFEKTWTSWKSFRSCRDQSPWMQTEEPAKICQQKRKAYSPPDGDKQNPRRPLSMVPDHEPAAARYATNPGPDAPAQLRPFTSALTQESVALPSKDFPSIMRQGQPMAVHSERLPEATIVVDVPMAAGRLRNLPSAPEPHFHSINSSMESKISEVSSVNMQTDPDEPDDPADSVCLPSQPRDQKIMHRPLDPRPKPPQVAIEGKHNLNFIVENKDGEVDLDNDLPSVEGTTVAAFLQIFSEKSGIKIDDSVEKLSFTLEFNDDVTLFLRQSDSEEVWGIIKGRIKNLFRRAVKKQPEKTRFIVWVNALERQ